jgi:hypothetical protein
VLVTPAIPEQPVQLVQQAQARLVQQAQLVKQGHKEKPAQPVLQDLPV